MLFNYKKYFLVFLSIPLVISLYAMERGVYLNNKLLEAALGSGINEVKRLIECGADVNAKNEDGKTPLLNAVESGHIDVMSCLIEHRASVNAKNEDGETPLFWAAWNGQGAVIGCLIGHRADINEKDKNGATSLSFAAWNGQNDAVDCLIKYRANVNAEDKDNETPLFDASWKGQVNTIKRLIEHRADVNKTNKYGRTPLFDAICNEQVDAIDCLTKHRADVNHQDSLCLTPLSIALAVYNLRDAQIVTEKLCNAGASLLIHENNTVFHVALANDKKLIPTLMTHARFDSLEEIICQRAENEQRVREKIELVFFLCNMHNIPMDIKCLILSKLPLHYLQENGKSSKRLIDLGYKHHILAQVCDRVERLQEILQMKDSEHRTPLELLNEKHQADQQYISELTPLLDESRLRGDIHDFCEAFPDTSLLSPGNLIYKMYHKSE